MKTRSLVGSVALLVACGSAEPPAPLTGHVDLVLLHSADIHAQLFPWRTVVGAADAYRGLGATGELAEVGGFARLATLIRAQRASAQRVLHLDSGDLFQGSLAFERFGPEPEILGFEALGVNAQALGNHELDHGAGPVREAYGSLATFPLLAANYAADGAAGIGAVLQPYVLLDSAGLRVGVIGVGNVGSVGLLRERPSELGVVALETAGAVQGAIDALRPQADVIVALTHLGLSGDEVLVSATSGLDLVLGGHQHIALDEPEWVTDCGGGASVGHVRDAWGRERACTPRRVAIVHSGAYGKFLGKLTLELDDAVATPSDPLDRFELSALHFELLPVRADTSEDAAVAALLEPYRPSALDFGGAAGVIGFAPDPVERIGATGGDSPLGNFAAEAARSLAEAELAVIGASSLRHDLPPGLLDAETLARVLPFDDPLVRLLLPGAALARAFERAAQSASARDCRTQVHVAGLLVRFTCPCRTEHCATIYPTETRLGCRSDADCTSIGGACAQSGACFAPLVREASYELATTEYLARGGSGIFEPITGALQPAGDDLRSAVSEALRRLPAAPVEGQDAPLPVLDSTIAYRDGRIRFEGP